MVLSEKFKSVLQKIDMQINMQPKKNTWKNMKILNEGLHWTCCDQQKIRQQKLSGQECEKELHKKWGQKCQTESVWMPSQVFLLKPSSSGQNYTKKIGWRILESWWQATIGACLPALMCQKCA